MDTQIVAQRAITFKIAQQIARVNVRGVVCAVPRNELRAAGELENDIEQARDAFVEAARSLTEWQTQPRVMSQYDTREVYEDAFDILTHAIERKHANELRLVAQYRVARTINNVAFYVDGEK